MTLQASGIPIREFAQTQANCTLMGQTLFDLLTGLDLEVYPSDELRQQALSIVAVIPGLENCQREGVKED